MRVKTFSWRSRSTPARGKDYLVALRPFEGRLLMHQLYHADEVLARCS